MATLTSILATNIVSSTRSVINTNFQNLNAQTQIIYKSADQTSASSVLASDSHLVFPVGVNEVWGLEKVFLLYNAAAAPDIKVGWTVPAGTTMAWEVEGNYGSNVSLASDTESMNGTGADAQFSLHGTIFVGSVAGNMTLRWAQNVNTASSIITLKQGSFIIAHKLN